MIAGYAIFGKENLVVNLNLKPPNLNNLIMIVSIDKISQLPQYK